MNITKGYEITEAEVNLFVRALGLDPAELISLHIEGRRVVATVEGPERLITIPIRKKGS